mgnify:CR=1 FL=1
MREKVLTTVVTFGTTTQAIAMERECKKAGFEGRLIPVPREISASCGLCVEMYRTRRRRNRFLYERTGFRV